MEWEQRLILINLTWDYRLIKKKDVGEILKWKLTENQWRDKNWEVPGKTSAGRHLVFNVWLYYVFKL